jgi:hypothetical protein
VHKFEINLSVYMRQRGFSVLALHPSAHPGPFNIAEFVF